MNQLIHVKGSEPSQNSNQKTFHRLLQKIERLQRKLSTRFQELDAGLEFYKHKIWPAERKLVPLLQEMILNLYKYFKKTQLFSKNELKLLRELILVKIDDLFNMIHPSEADEKIRLIFKELEGVSCEDVMANQFDQIKRVFEETLSEHGIGLDLSQIYATDKEDIIVQKIMKAVSKAGETHEQLALKKRQSKKQIEKERKAKELEELQQKGLGSIYKQLVKIFHPDLEQDIKLKAEKEELMKNLTTAYERKDLYTLLSLQIGWMNRLEGRTEGTPDKQLQIYNSILKDQVKELEERVQTAHLDPKYFAIQHYLDLDFGIGNRTLVLRTVHSEIMSDIHALTQVNAQLTGRSNFEYARHLIQSFNRVNGSSYSDFR